MENITDNKFDIEGTLQELNTLWTLTLDNVIDYLKHVKEVKRCLREVVSNGYNIVFFERLSTQQLSVLCETGREKSNELEKVRTLKKEAFSKKDFQNTARLRAVEKDLLEVIAAAYFGKEQTVHFLLSDSKRKNVLYRKAAYRFQVPNIILSWDNGLDRVVFD